MVACSEFDGKDKVVFVTKDYQDELAEKFPPPPEPKPRSAVDPVTGEIDWDCPCLAGLTSPPCGELFKASFSCFVNSKEDVKGSDCGEAFIRMQECFKQYPDQYPDYLGKINDSEKEDAENDDEESLESDSPQK